MNINEIGIFLNQTPWYNFFETAIVVLSVAYWVWIVKLSLED